MPVEQINRGREHRRRGLRDAQTLQGLFGARALPRLVGGGLRRHRDRGRRPHGRVRRLRRLVPSLGRVGIGSV